LRSSQVSPAAAWKIIKTWLPASGVRKVKFVNKSNLDEFVSADQRLTAWGGEDDWEYDFEPERRLEPTSPSSASAPPSYNSALEDSFQSPRVQTMHSMVEFDSDGNDDLRRKVHFANNNNRQGLLLASPTSPQLPGEAQKILQSQDSVASQISAMSRTSSFASNAPENVANLLSLTPSEEVVFTQNPQGDLVAKVKVQNACGKAVAFKVSGTEILF
jgi:hypothetical protein